MDEEIKKEGIIYDLNLEKRVVSAAKGLAAKLNEEIAKGNDTGAFMLAVLLAAFKDFIDVVLAFLVVGEIPGVNFLVGLFLTSFLFFFMLGKGWFLKWRIKFWFWVLGLFVDGLPVVGILPMNTLLVLYAWRITKKRAEKGKLKLRNLNNLTEKEIGMLNNDISLLETDYDLEKTRNKPQYQPKNVQNRTAGGQSRFNLIKPQTYPTNQSAKKPTTQKSEMGDRVSYTKDRFNLQKAPSENFREIELQGSEEFREKMKDALRFLSFAKDKLKFAQEYVKRIQQSEHTGMNVLKDKTTFEVGNMWKDHSAVYMGSGIAHEAYHSYLWKNSVNPDPAKTYSGKEAEKMALGFQIETLNDMMDSDFVKGNKSSQDEIQKTIEHLKELMINPTYQDIPYEQRDW